MRLLRSFLKKRSIIFSIIYFFMLFFLSKSMAQEEINQKDYMSVEKKNFYGRGPLIGTAYWLGLINSNSMQQVTFNMFNTQALLIKIRTKRKNSGVIMLASQIGTPGVLRAVWKCDNIIEPIIFWTDRFWIPENECNSRGCPKIRFQATSGECDVIILDKKAY